MHLRARLGALIIGSGAVAASAEQLRLVGVTDPAAPGLVVAVADLWPDVTAEFCPPVEPVASHQRRGDWVLDTASHRGTPRKFWYSSGSEAQNFLLVS